MSNDEIMTKLRQIIGDYFGVDAGSVRHETVSSEVSGWDSVSYAGLLMHVEDSFGIEIEPDDAWGFEDVGQMAGYIAQVLAKGKA